MPVVPHVSRPAREQGSFPFGGFPAPAVPALQNATATATPIAIFQVATPLALFTQKPTVCEPTRSRCPSVYQQAPSLTDPWWTLLATLGRSCPCWRRACASE